MTGEADRRERIEAALLRYETSSKKPDYLRRVKKSHKMSRKGGIHETNCEKKA